MISINVKSNVKQFTRHLTRIEKKQVPFATARALTWTAQDVQKWLIKKIPSIFNVTKKWWLKQQPTGIKIKPAKKNYLVSSIYTKAYFANLQEEGGTKRPTRSKNLVIPTKKVPKSRRKAGGAAVMLKGKKVFSTARGIYRRKGGKKSRTIELLFHKERSANIKPRFNFRQTAHSIATRMFKRNFLRSLAGALKTRR
ncbi:MAG: hypothetical protein SWH54_04550 [Thermodesulfobacteriota bacterium]|nr:hypothetical protein [Thermodesulfobacteriota bacterium]